jgi:hypothetical protein
MGENVPYTSYLSQRTASSKNEIFATRKDYCTDTLTCHYHSDMQNLTFTSEKITA